MHIAVASIQGATGSTTTAIHFAAYLEALGPTLLLDGDSNRTATAWAAKSNSLPYQVADVRSGREIAREFEHLVTDCGLRQSNAHLKDLAEGCDLLVIPAVTMWVDNDHQRQILDAFAGIEADNYRVLITMASPGQSKVANLRDTLETAGIPTFTAVVPRLEAFQKAAAAGVIVSAVRDPQAARAWEAYVSVGSEILLSRTRS